MLFQLTEGTRIAIVSTKNGGRLPTLNMHWHGNSREWGATSSHPLAWLGNCLAAWAAVYSLFALKGFSPYSLSHLTSLSWSGSQHPRCKTSWRMQSPEQYCHRAGGELPLPQMALLPPTTMVSDPPTHSPFPFLPSLPNSEPPAASIPQPVPEPARLKAEHFWSFQKQKDWQYWGMRISGQNRVLAHDVVFFQMLWSPHSFCFC